MKKVSTKKMEGTSIIERIKAFFADQSGVNTLEILIIAAVLVAVALLFREQLMDFVKSITVPIFGTKKQITQGLPEATTGIITMLFN